jgi:hypothetical protein
MRRTLALAALVAGLVLTSAWPVAPALASVSVTIRNPSNGALVGETLSVAATVVSTDALATVTAQVEDRQTGLTFSNCAFVDGSCRPGLAGSLSLLGLARGSHVLTVTATDVLGASAQGQRTITFDLPPSLSVASPLQGTVARPHVDVNAACSDDDGCTVRVTVNRLRSVIASGVGTVQARVTLAAFEGHSVLLNFEAVDSAGQHAVAERRVYVESSGRYVEVETATGVILDADSGRVLALDRNDFPSVLELLDRATGDEESVPAVEDRQPAYGFLAPLGAIFVAGGISGPLMTGVYEWRAGSLIKLEGRVNSQYSLRAAGPFAIWVGSPDPTCCVTNVFRRDLVNGVTINLGDAGNTDDDVAENGDVVFWGAPSGIAAYEIFRYRDGTTTQLTNDTALWNTYPVTDGVNVVYRKHTPCCGAQTFAIAMFGEAGEVILAPARTREPIPGWDYLVAGGWVAYTKSGIGGELQVWRRAPDGTESQVSFFGTSSRLFGLSPTGEVLFTNGRLYLSRPGSELLDVASTVVLSSSAAGGADRPFWIDGEWHVAVGRSLFRIDTDNMMPAVPALLAQSRTDRSATIPVGGMTPETKVVLRATVNDADVGQTVKLQIEVQPLGTAFTNRSTAEGPLVTSGSTAFVTVGPLANGSYHWQTRAVDQSGVASPWVPFGGNAESVADFTVNLIVPPAPTLVLPTGTITDRTPSYTWNAVAAATSYLLHVDDAVTAKKIYRTYTAATAGCYAGTGTCSVTPGTLLSAGAGTWRVHAQTSLGTGPSSSIMAFTVVTSPPSRAPTLIAPTGTVPNTTPTYTWNAVPEATSYVLQVNDAVTTKKIYTKYSAGEAGCPSGTGRCSVTPPTALTAGAARWGVQARNALGNGPWPSMLTFAVFAGPPSSAPTLIMPTGAVADTTPTYRWTAVEGAASYVLQVNDVLTVRKIYTTYTAAEAACAGGTGRCSVTPPTALTAGQARWRVQAQNSFGQGPWPISLTFTVDSP